MFINPVENAKSSLEALVSDAYNRAAADGKLPSGAEVTIAAEIPRDPRNGDYATSFALAASKQLGKPPREIAQIVCDYLQLDGSPFSSAEIAGPGFINLRLGGRWYHDVLISAQSADYGRSDDGKGRSVQVEFVSANPTGPMTIGNARGGVLGDSLASVLDYNGWKVTREFYLNDAGNQIMMFGRSLDARYMQLIHGTDAVEFPDDGYHGDDIRELAEGYRAINGDALAALPSEEREAMLVEYGLHENVERMKRDLERYGINYNVWFAESELHRSGYVKETIDMLVSAGHTYQSEGAVWFKGTEFGLDKDEVLVKSNGFYTYYAVDIAYHRNKFVERKIDKVIDALGADHHGHTLRFRAGLSALGIDPEKLDFLLFQFVRLYRDGELVKVSKRSGKAISLADLLDEVPLDATRFLFNMQTSNSVMEFDMDLAIKQTSENPVYYVQYAHARICSLLKTLDAEGDVTPEAPSVDITLLKSDEEIALVKHIAMFPEQIRLAAKTYEPSMINRYLIDIAGAFHSFYSACRIRGEEADVKALRLCISQAVRDVLSIGLHILGVTAPEKM